MTTIHFIYENHDYSVPGEQVNKWCWDTSAGLMHLFLRKDLRHKVLQVFMDHGESDTFNIWTISQKPSLAALDSEWVDIFLKNPSHFEDNVLFGYFAIFPTFIILRNLQWITLFLAQIV